MYNVLTAMQTKHTFPPPLAAIIIDYALPSCEMKTFNYLMRVFKSECNKSYSLEEFGYHSLQDLMSNSTMIPVRYISENVNQEFSICDIVYYDDDKGCPCENCFEEDYHEENYVDPPSLLKRNAWCRRNVWKQLYKQHNEARNIYIRELSIP